MRKLTVAVLAVTLVAAGALAGQALHDWEWTRAVWMTVAFVAVEVALIGVLVLGRLRDLAARLDERPPDPVLARVVEARPPTHDHFAWLRDTMGRTNVFVTMVVGGGVLLSGVIWVIDQVARRTVTPTWERRLAGELRELAPPRGSLVPPEDVLLAEDLPAGERDDLWLLLTGRRGAPHRP